MAATPQFKLQERLRGSKRWQDVRLGGFDWTGPEGWAERYARSMRRKFGRQWECRVRKV